MDVRGGDPRAWLILTATHLGSGPDGRALTVAGVVMQQLAQNRLVEPGTVGTTESAGLGLPAVSLLAPSAAVWLKMLARAATAGTALFLAIVRRLPPREVLLVPIAGIVLAGILQSTVKWIAWQADLLQYVQIWLMSGEFSGVIARRYDLLSVAGAAALLAWFAADRFAMLGLSLHGVMRLIRFPYEIPVGLIAGIFGSVIFLGLLWRRPRHG